MFGYTNALYLFTAKCNTWLPLLEEANHSQDILESSESRNGCSRQAKTKHEKAAKAPFNWEHLVVGL